MTNKKKATLRDVAQEASVSESTASRALADNSLISGETKARVLAAAAKLNYIIRRKAIKSESSKPKGMVGVIVAALHNSFYPLLIDRIHAELEASGFGMVLIIDEFANSTSSRKMKSLIETPLDGLMMMTTLINSPVVDLLASNKIPTILAIRSNQKHNVDVIECDNHMAGEQAVKHLLGLGHKRIAFLMGPENTSTAADRMAGARRVMDRSGVDFDPDLVVWGEFTHDSGYSGMVHLMTLAHPPTAVFCGNDVVAIGAMDSCSKLGVDIPRDVSIIGVDDVPMASWEMISLTTIRQPIFDIGVGAVKQIIKRIEGGPDAPPVRNILPTSLVQRRTTSVPKGI